MERIYNRYMKKKGFWNLLVSKAFLFMSTVDKISYMKYNGKNITYIFMIQLVYNIAVFFTG